MVMNLTVTKVTMNLKCFAQCEKVVEASLNLLQDLAVGFMSGELLLWVLTAFSHQSPPQMAHHLPLTTHHAPLTQSPLTTPYTLASHQYQALSLHPTHFSSEALLRSS
jgi:hypothetical protein